MRHPGLGIGILGGVGLLTFVLDAAGVGLPGPVLGALAVLAVLLIVGGVALELGVDGGSGHGERESVRPLLDEAVAALHDTAYALDQARLRLIQSGFAFFNDDEGARQFAAVGRAGQRLDSLLERLKVRFRAEDEIVVAFAGADEATLAIYRALG